MSDTVLTYYVLDLDRTLFDTIKATELMRGVIALHDPEMAASLERQFEEYTSRGESFSMRDFIVETVGEEEMQKIEQKYKQVGTDWDLLMPGAKELIAYLDTREDTAFGILTYGSVLGQTMKIDSEATLKNIPYMMTMETYKGAQIASWRHPDGLYHIPEELGGVTAQTIVFVDDKPFSFKGLPIDCRGYLVKSVYDAGIDKLPSKVVAVDNLIDVLAAERQAN